MGLNKEKFGLKIQSGEELISPVNVVDEYYWTVSPKKSTNNKKARDEAPRIILLEMQQTMQQIFQSGKFWVEQVFKQKTAADNPYESLYLAEETGHKYIFPFYSTYHHVVQNNWGEHRGPLENAAAKVSDVAKLFYPSAGVQGAKAWMGSTAASYSFMFYLLNTIGTDQDIKNNKLLIDTLIQANLEFRINAVASYPPVFYQVDIPGVRVCPAAVISSLTINNIGQLNTSALGTFKDVEGIPVPGLIPEAYEIQIQITELINESRQIYMGATGGQKINAISSPPPAAAAAAV